MARILLGCLATALVVHGEVPEFIKLSAVPTASFTLNAGTYGDGKFIAVGNNIILYSTDEGVTWHEADGFPAMTFRSVICGNGRFVTVGDASNCAVSDDGAHWKTYPLTSGGNEQYSLRSLAYGNGAFAVAGLTRPGVEYVSGTSSDGIQWSFPIKPAGGSVAFLNGGFLFLNQTFSKVPQTDSGYPLQSCGPLVGGDGTAAVVICTYGNSFYFTRMFRSTDGVSWGQIGGMTTFNSLYPSGTRALALQSGPGGLFDPITSSGQNFGPPAPSFTSSGTYALSSNTIVALFGGPIQHRPIDSTSWIANDTPNLVLTSSTASSNIFVAVGRTNGAANSSPQVLVATNGLPYVTSISTADPLNAVRSGS